MSNRLTLILHTNIFILLLSIRRFERECLHMHKPTEMIGFLLLLNGLVCLLSTDCSWV